MSKVHKSAVILAALLDGFGAVVTFVCIGAHAPPEQPPHCQHLRVKAWSFELRL